MSQGAVAPPYPHSIKKMVEKLYTHFVCFLLFSLVSLIVLYFLEFNGVMK